MTPTLTGETVTLTDGDYSRVISCGGAEVLGRELLRLADVAKKRIRAERNAIARAAFLAAHPSAVDLRVDIWGCGMVNGIGAVVIDGEDIRAKTWFPVPHPVESIGILPTWHTPIQMRIGNGRVAHTWQGGMRALCGMEVRCPTVPRAQDKPCARCAAKVAG